MNYFTKQEKLCLVSFFVVVFTGLFLQVAFKKYPYLNDIVNVMDNDAFYPKVNVNQANLETLKNLPGIGAFTAQAIIDYREEVGVITSIDEIERLPGVYPKNFKRFKSYLKVGQK